MGSEETGRQQGAAIALSLVPVALGLLGPLAGAGGRPCWLAPAVALPVGLAAVRLWRALGKEGLPRALDAAFGRVLGGLLRLLYLLWGLALLLYAARRYAGRLAAAMGGARWLYLLGGLALVLWLSRREGKLLRRGSGLLLLAVLAALLLTLALALPAVDWRELRLPARGEGGSLWQAALLVLSLSGWGVMGLTEPTEDERRPSALLWMSWGWALLTALLAVVLGIFGPVLAAGMKEPFLYILEGAGVPGLFRRGQAALCAVLALGDLALLTLLTRSCGVLWESLAPAAPGLGRWVLPTAVFLAAGFLQGERLLWMEELLPVGGLVFGLVLPALVVFTEKAGRRHERDTISCGQKGEKTQGIDPEKESEKS